MSDDKPLKSAVELAMERLQARDRERGEARTELNDRQKKRIAEAREEAKARLAELEIMHRKKLAETGGEPEKLAELEQHFKIDRERIESSLESKIGRIKRG